jgi:ribonuclease P protein component
LSENGVTVSASAWPPSAGGEFSPIDAEKGASASLPELFVAPAVRHLKRRSQFLRIARSGRKWAMPGLVLQVGRGDARIGAADPAAAIRVGFTASRKVGNAVARNRVRRRLRAAAEEILPVHARPGRDYVIIGRAATLRRPFHALLGDLENALKRVGAYRNVAEPDDGAGGKETFES